MRTRTLNAPTLPAPETGRIPADKELDGYDWTPIRFPVDYGRQRIESAIHQRPRGPRPVWPPGTGKTHLAIRAWQERMPQGHARALLHGRGPGHAAPAGSNGQSARPGTRHDQQNPAVDHRRGGQ